MQYAPLVPLRFASASPATPSTWTGTVTGKAAGPTDTDYEPRPLPSPCVRAGDQHLGVTQHQSGPGMVPLRPFVTARLDEEDATGHDPAVVAAHRRIVDAWHASRSPVHRAGLELAVKAVAGIWSDHPDFDPTWRS